MKKVLITGINGMLGRTIYDEYSKYPNDFIIYGIDRTFDDKINNIVLELTNYDEGRKILSELKPDVIIHTAALIDVDFCEKNREIAYEINTKVTEFLSEFCTKIVFISSDSVYGDRFEAFKENDEKKPLNYYAFTKSVAEDILLKKSNKAIVIRTNIYGFNQMKKGKSLFEWAYENLKKGNKIYGFTDVFFNPVYTEQLAIAIYKLVNFDYSGVINVGSSSCVSKYDFIVKLAREFKLDSSLIEPTSIDSILSNRPKNTCLDLTTMEREIGIQFQVESGLNMLSKKMKEGLRNEKSI